MNLFVRIALWWFFKKVTFGQHNVAAIREAASRGRIIYTLQTRSRFDQLYFNFAFLKHDLPLALWSNGPRTFWFRPIFSMLGYLLRRRRKDAEADLLQAHIEAGNATLIFLDRPFSGEVALEGVSDLHLEKIVEMQATSETPFLVVPLLAIWERRNEDFNPSLLDGVFGTRQRPGFFRKMFHVLKNLWQAFFLIGPPLVQVSRVLDLQNWLEERGDDESPAVAAHALHTELVTELDQERAVVVGPKIKKAQALKREILNEEAFLAEIRVIARDTNRSEEEVLADARKYLDRVSADVSLLMIKFLAVVMTPMFQLIYDGLEVDEEGLEKVREAARDGRLIVIPSHKSHIDYLIISYIFFEYGLVPPLIAAGDNLNFPPVGQIFKRSGAFFIRRQFKGDQIYALCLKRYIGKLLVEGYPIEFFIEGGRSRVGKLLSPRFGMLRMIVENFLEEKPGPVRVVPCNVTYERVIEGESHQKEVAGGEKKQENIGALLRSTRILTSRYGRLYVSFGDPIDLGTYLQRYDVGPGSDNKALEQVTQRLGYRVIYEINQAGIATPSAVTAVVLLNSTARGMRRQPLLEMVGFALDLLNERGVRLSPSLQKSLASRRTQLEAARAPAGSALPTPPALAVDSQPSEDNTVHHLWGKAVEDVVDEAIRLFTDGNLVDVTVVDPKAKGADRFVYSVPEKARGELSYYRNMIVHEFVPDALLSAALLEPGTEAMDVDALMQRTLLLSKLFKYEFFYEERAEFANVFWRTFERFEARGWVRSTGQRSGQAILKAWPMPPLEYFRDMVLTFLEAYTLVGAEFDALDDWMEEAEFVEHLLVRCQVHYHEGRVRFLETLAKPTFRNALRRFVDWGYVEVETIDKRRKVVRRYRRVPEKVEAHDTLLYQLRCLLHGRKKIESSKLDAA